MAADTRVSRGYSVMHRNLSKIHQLSENAYILSSGMLADRINLWKKLDETITLYEYKMGRKPDVHACAALVSNVLYGKRFFPFYTFNLVAGIDANGKGVCYNYDAIGSHEAYGYGCQGSSKELMTSTLDNQLEGICFF